MTDYEIRPMQADDRERVATLAAQSFHLPTPSAKAVEYYVPEDWVVLEDRRGVQAALHIVDAAHWIGGASVAAGFVHALMASAESRSKGYGSALLRHGMDDLRDRGVPMSSLFASVSQAYRQSGYEYAGARYRYRVASDHLAVNPGPLEVEPFGDDDLDEIAGCYRRVAMHHNGPVDRPRGWWGDRILRKEKRELIHRYLVRDASGEVRAYVVYTHEKDPGRFAPEFVDDDIGYPYRVVCRELVWETIDAANALLTMFARGGSVCTDLIWMGEAEDPLVTLVPRREVIVDSRQLWMSRLVDAEAAFLARGYRPSASASVDFVIHDRLSSEPTALRLDVEAGKPSVSPGSGKGVRIGVGALASVFLSWMAPRDALRLGLLEDASEADLDAMDTLFAGRSPWAFDLF